jgi:hypothetical protein
MAAFIVRSWSTRLWNGPEAFQTQVPPYSSPYFVDVPAGSPRYIYIQKLYELGITSGFTAPVISGGQIVTQGIYCPNTADNNYPPNPCGSSALLDNYQVAVFVARARALSDKGCIGQYRTASVP